MSSELNKTQIARSELLKRAVVFEHETLLSMLNAEKKRWANQILSSAKEGADVSSEDIRSALCLTGDLDA